MKTGKRQRNTPIERRSKSARAVLPALVAASGGLAAGTASAIELGELEVRSKLGQPLRASIAYALGPNEIIGDYCVSIRSGGNGVPDAFVVANISVADGLISLTGRSPVFEPMMSANIVVDCPYTPHVNRNYMLFLDPQDTRPTVASAASARQPAAPVKVATAAATTRSAPVSRRERVAAAPVEQGSSYRVQRGDSLSRIAQRVGDRQPGLQAAMDAIFAANPDAFINNDPDSLKAGSLLIIPPPPGTETAPQTAAAADTPAATIDTVEQPFEPVITDTANDVVESTTTAVENTESSESSSAFADLQPGDVIFDSGIEISPAAASSNDAASPIIGSPATTKSSWDWLIWLAAGGITLFAGFLLFGQRLRERFGSTPVGAAEQPIRPLSAQGTPGVAPTAVPDAAINVEEFKPAYDNVDFDLSDDSPTEENLALDADLVIGTGLDDSTDVDVNQDFGFAVTTELDVELPETAAREDEAPETDIIPPLERTSLDMIVDSDVPPDDGEYDMSVVLDATKMPDPADVTERDLKAVPIEEDGQTLISGAHTISKEVDYEILEKDYQDELTATQALNEEIEKAAAELAERMEGGDESDDVATAEVQLTNMSDLDMTANLEAQNDDVGEDLDVTANIEAEDKTTEMPAKDGTKAN